ncbi:hypothetical protein [Spirulina subsalsa]|uniref:hypothetical protein n=1 Tax=Spirulina subsalsa TaxID=54311 RepID=UPI000303E2C4|nr:hypothetical protein [Spirulina subsalsa]
MSLSHFKNIGSVLKEFQITYAEANFIEPCPFEIPDYFREYLEFMMNEGVVDNSEYAICENLIYPVLKQVWKQYSRSFILWSHQSLNYTEDLSGFPEYILAKRSELGKLIFDQPYFLLVEAKQDKFAEGWAQCLAEIIAAQRLNQIPHIIVFGIVSNGKNWEFGKLEGSNFTKNKEFYSIQSLDHLFSAIHYIFRQCEVQLNSLVLV